MTKEFVTKTKNNVAVYVDMEGSHASTHLTDSPQLLALVKEALRDAEPVGGGEFVRVEKDMGRIVGMTDLVEVNEGDEVVYAKRPKRVIYTKFVKNRAPVPSSFITIWLRRDSEKEFELFSCYIGRPVPAFPGDEYEEPASRPFWEKHALVWGTQAIIEGTETQNCPW